MRRLTKEEVEHVAYLARLSLTEEEKEMFTEQLNRILEAFAQLQQLPTDDVEPLSHIIPLKNVFAEDEPKDSLPVDEALANAPEKEDGYFLVPRIIED
ncbi:Asp-tRNA(Asn)/Glu-tRNA(Gln) amidotransferase subunit GatC [bacterium]|nr:Asp-tRNA(Asn)/Glu-tRNA(Gln) amidotransferase subunit GatC [bacterium]